MAMSFVVASLLLLRPWEVNADHCHPAGGHQLFDYVHVFENGTTQLAPAVLDNATGECYFPDANCASDVVSSGTSCCSPTSPIANDANNSENIATYGQLVVYVAAIYCAMKWLNSSRPPGQEAPTALSGTPEQFNKLVLFLSIAWNVFAGIFMANSTQKTLSISYRNAMMAVSAFLTPFKDIFQFIEDIAVVKVSFAVGSGNPRAVRKVLYTCIAGGFVCGVVGAVLMTVLAFWPAAFSAFATPGHAKSLQDFQGCALLPDASTIVGDVKPLWLLSCWSWVFAFCGTALSGLLMASREFALLGASSALASAALIGIWNFGPKPQDLILLGIAGFVSGAISILCMSMSIFFNSPLREKYALYCLRTSRDEQEETDHDQSTLVDGLMAMVYDVTLQLMGSVTVYIAAFESLPTLYQLSAAGAALPQYTAYASGVSFMCKLVGAGLIGHGSYDRFRKFMNGMLGVAILLGLVAFVAIYPFRTAISATYAKQSCGFAYSQSCLGVYRDLFGHEGIDITFEIFTFSASFTCITAVARAGLYACQDYAFMAKTSVVAFVLVFIPALLIARFAFQSAAALYLAASLPGWILSVVFLLRLQYNTRKMMRDERGPWSGRAEAVASLTQSLDPSRVEGARAGSSRISSFPVLL